MDDWPDPPKKLDLISEYCDGYKHQLKTWFPSPKFKEIFMKVKSQEHLQNQTGLLPINHSGHMSGHFSGERLYRALVHHWWWPCMYSNLIVPPVPNVQSSTVLVR